MTDIIGTTVFQLPRYLREGNGINLAQDGTDQALTISLADSIFLYVLLSNATANLTAGYTATTYDAGTISSGTFTPDETLGNEQKYTNNGAHTLAPPTLTAGRATAMTIDITNGASAGVITNSGFTKRTGDSFTTTSGHKFKAFIHNSDLGSFLNVVAMQ